MPKISVIMPVYNSQDYVEDAIRSVLNQTFSDFELIVIDDGSKDNSGKICDCLAEEDSRIRVTHIENGGLCHARNLALLQAKGEYLAFCDNDDYFDPCLLEKAYTIAVQNDADCVTFGRMLKQYSAEGELMRMSSRAPRYEATVQDGEIFEQLEAWFLGGDGVWCRIYRRQLIENNNICFDESLRHGMEDLLFNQKVLSCARTISYLPNILYTWVRRELHSASMTISDDTLEGIVKFLECEDKLLKENGVFERNPALYVQCMMEAFIFQIINVRYKHPRNFKIERYLYEELRKAYLPYVESLRSAPMPLSYKIELEFVMHKLYRLLYWMIVITGKINLSRKKDR